mmetsp:Transcript_34053/g.78530  ORF Transcript_34053/g.78530 Transcript_34053/m.78530 type:complete len:126 (-) Transcript_34053:621-998(-)
MAASTKNTEEAFRHSRDAEAMKVTPKYESKNNNDEDPRCIRDAGAMTAVPGLWDRLKRCTATDRPIPQVPTLSQALQDLRDAWKTHKRAQMHINVANWKKPGHGNRWEESLCTFRRVPVVPTRGQ